MSDTKRDKWSAQPRHPAGVHWDTVIRDGNGDPICTVVATGWDQKSHWRHAHLIARAPEMYEELETCVERLRAVYEGDEWSISIEEMQRWTGLLARARGEEPDDG